MTDAFGVRLAWVGPKCELLLIPNVVPGITGFVCDEDPVTQDEIDQNATVCLFRSTTRRLPDASDPSSGTSEYVYHCFLADSLVDWFLKHQPFELPTTRERVDPEEANRVIKTVDGLTIYVEFVSLTTEAEMNALMASHLEVHGPSRTRADRAVCLFRVLDRTGRGRHELLCLDAAWFVRHCETHFIKTIPDGVYPRSLLSVRVEDLEAIRRFVDHETTMERKELRERYAWRRGRPGETGGGHDDGMDAGESGDVEDYRDDVFARELERALFRESDDEDSFLSEVLDTLDAEDQRALGD